ncbi:MAG TPA: SCO6880 family protein [Acidimicrobiales bacterium]|nr:SCO6880 family protein [Acidimicrobiales bacterium]
MAGEGTRYRFGPRERSGALAGWRAGQILTVALGLLFGVVALRQLPNVGGVAVAVLLLLVCAALATWPIAGRTGEQWAPVIVRWGVRHTSSRPGRSKDSLGGLRLLQGEWREMGMVHDVRGRTLTAALSLRGQSFALLGPDEQDRRVAGWSAALAAVAREGSPVRRLQWLAASFPDEGHGVRSYLARQTSVDAASASVASYESLLSEMDADACTHDVVLAVQVRLTKSVEVAAEALRREVSSLSRLLTDADVVVERIMTADDVAAQLLRTYEPHGGPTPGQWSMSDPWPMAMAEEWGSVRVDAMVHATFWVAEWPRTEVRADFLAPLLLGASRATLSITMEPLGPEQAVRKVEASRTADLADAELRRRSGFMSTARHARQSEVLARRESELADGHASFRYAGFVTVSAPSEAELVTACDAVEHAAGQCRLLLRRLYGDQASAYTCTLPLARGLT